MKTTYYTSASGILILRHRALGDAFRALRRIHPKMRRRDVKFLARHARDYGCYPPPPWAEIEASGGYTLRRQY